MKGIGRHRRCGRSVLALLLVAASVLTGCRIRLPGSTDPLIKIGLVAPFEGQLRARGYEVLYAVKLAVRQWNEVGGVGGYRVELVALDDGGDPTLALQQVRELIVDRDVLGVIGHFTEETTAAAAPGYAARGLALVAAGVGAEEVTAGGGVIRLGPSNRFLGQEAARYALSELSAERVAVLRGRDDLADAFVAAVHQLGGTIVLDASVAGDGWVFHLADAAPDLVFFSGGAMEGAEAIRLARQSGVEAAFLGGPAMGDRALVQVGDPWTEGTAYLAAAPAAPDLAGAEAFVADYQSLAGQEPGPRATLAYAAANLLLEAISQAADRLPGRPSRSKVREQLMGGFQHEGLLGRMTFGVDGEATDWPVAVYRVKAGSYLGQRLR